MFWNYNFRGFLASCFVCAIFYELTHNSNNSGIIPLHLAFDMFVVCIFTFTFVISLILYLVYKDTNEDLFKMLHSYLVLIIIFLAIIYYESMA